MKLRSLRESKAGGGPEPVWRRAFRTTIPQFTACARSKPSRLSWIDVHADANPKNETNGIIVPGGGDEWQDGCPGLLWSVPT